MSENTQLQLFIQNALQEDLGDGDHSSLACIPATAVGEVQLLAKENGILAGVNAALEVFKTVDSQIQTTVFMHDGAAIAPGDVVLKAKGSSRSLLAAERLLLNIMQRMSGIATHANRLMRLTEGTKAVVLDTRKTTPGMRFLEKEAVKIGGGGNHRFGLYDMIMLKDNHIDFAGGIPQAIDSVHEYLKKKGKSLRIEVEARDLDEVQQILDKGGIHRIMLDNFSVEDTRTAVALINGQYEVESSGGITETTLQDYARCGVDFISVGALTHHIKSLDLSLKAV
ncbi:MAG: carboxylating nicotinate-nucleotide diphosphorylase [Schleiferiaceae bacterium]|nr:carboxylating nicotinate-nucleotide diphosphorylase [Schleiferiaceae bacterium]